MERYSHMIYVQEVVTRDGFQNEGHFVPTNKKIELINKLSKVGLNKIEVTSFVSPKAVPNLRDAEEVMDGDRKSTRLNSSHVSSSYAVFCLIHTRTMQIYSLSLHDALPIFYVQEVVTRDGFQNEGHFVPTNKKIELINKLSKVGLNKIEVTSFVSPKAVPNLRDAEEVMDGINRNPNITYSALVPNLIGARRAVECEVDEINLLVSASNT